MISLESEKTKNKLSTEINRNTYLNTLVFADDEVIIEDTEKKLRLSGCGLYQLDRITTRTCLCRKLNPWHLLGAIP